MSDAKKSTREKAASARAAAEASERRRERTVRIVIAAVVVLIVGGIIGAAVWSTQKDPTPPPDANTALPAGTSKTNLGAPVGTATKPVLDMYEDFQCPACAALERNLGSTIDQLVADGKLKVNYHPMTFLDQNLKNDASLRSAAAFGCAVDAGATEKYHNTVFANQPEKEGTGYTNEQLLDFAKQSGITGAAYDKFASCFQAQTYAGWATLSNEEAGSRGVTSTPTLFLNGQEVSRSDLTSVEAFKNKIASAGQ